MKFSAIIPARRGSKRLKDKNIKLLCGKPMISWTIEAAIKSKCFNEILISTNDRQVSRICENYDEATVLNRPDHLCLDDTPSDQVIYHALECLKDVDSFMPLQPTSPLRLPKHILEAKIMFEKGFQEYGTDSLISVSTRIINENWSVFVCPKTRIALSQCLSEHPDSARRFLNGAIYINTISGFKKRLTIKSDKTLVYEMPSNFSIDIDEISHFIESQNMMLKYKYFRSKTSDF